VDVWATDWQKMKKQPSLKKMGVEIEMKGHYEST
jgi:hypothetical protein